MTFIANSWSTPTDTTSSDLGGSTISDAVKPLLSSLLQEDMMSQKFSDGLHDVSDQRDVGYERRPFRSRPLRRRTQASLPPLKLPPLASHTALPTPARLTSLRTRMLRRYSSGFIYEHDEDDTHGVFQANPSVQEAAIAIPPHLYQQPYESVAKPLLLENHVLDSPFQPSPSPEEERASTRSASIYSNGVHSIFGSGLKKP